MGAHGNEVVWLLYETPPNNMHFKQEKVIKRRRSQAVIAPG